MDGTETFMQCRSLLFTPAVTPERFGNARRAGADTLIIDLEDGVALASKSDARSIACSYLSSVGSGPLGADVSDSPLLALRINSLRTKCGLEDLLALLECDQWPDILVVPKCESADEVRTITALLRQAKRESSIALVPMIESVRGLLASESIATCGVEVAALMFGGADLAAELGATCEWDALLHARSQVVQAASLAGLLAIDMPWLRSADEAGLASETERARRMGFRAKAAIHPRHIDTINRAMTPTDAELEHALRVVKAFAENAGRVCFVDGRLVEAPTVKAARRALAAAAISEPLS